MRIKVKVGSTGRRDDISIEDAETGERLEMVQ